MVFYLAWLAVSVSALPFSCNSGCAVRTGTADPRVLEMEVKGLLPPEF